MDTFFGVFCRLDSTPDGEKGEFVMATSRLFRGINTAMAYADGVDPSREPHVMNLSYDIAKSADLLNRKYPAKEQIE